MKLTNKNAKKFIVINKFSRCDIAGINYHKKLLAVVNRMDAEILKAISSEYEKNENKIAIDASPANTINDKLNIIIKKYTKLLKTNADTWAENFINEISNFTKNDLRKKARAAGLNIDFSKDSKKVLYKQDALILENVQLITSIPEETQTLIQGDVMRAMSEGRDMTYLKEQLNKRGIHNKKRVQLIARDQLSKATSTLNTQRATDAGFTEAVWLHSHGGKTQRQSHVKANNTIYNLNQGCKIDGVLTYPGQDINCRCNFKLIYRLPGDA